MSKNDLFQLGFILSQHGLKGEIKAKLSVDEPGDFSKMESVFVEINEKPVPFFITRITINKSGQAIILFEDMTYEKASRMRGNKLFILESSLPKKRKKQLDDKDVIGFKIIDRHVGEIGLVESLLEYPMQLLLQTTYQGNEVLIPIAENVILGINKKNKTIDVELPTGLLEINS